MSVLNSITDDDWKVVGGNPTKGEPEAISGKGRQFTELAKAATQARSDLIAFRDGQARSWEGSAAEAFRCQVSGDSKIVTDLLKLHDSYQTAGRALGTYAEELDELQRNVARQVDVASDAHHDECRTDSRLRDEQAAADTARDEASRWAREQARIAAQRQCLVGATDPSAHQQASRLDQEHAAASTRARNAATNANNADQRVRTMARSLDDIRERLAAARRSIKDAGERRKEAEDRCVSDLDRAQELGGVNQNAFMRFVDHIIPDSWLDELEKISGALQVIGDVLLVALIAAVVIVAIVGSGGAAIPFLLGAGAVIGMLKLGVDFARFAHGEYSGGKLAVDAAFVALSFIPISKAARGLRSVLGRGNVMKCVATLGPKGLKLARTARPISNAVRPLVSLRRTPSFRKPLTKPVLPRIEKGVDAIVHGLVERVVTRPDWSQRRPPVWQPCRPIPLTVPSPRPGCRAEPAMPPIGWYDPRSPQRCEPVAVTSQLAGGS